MRPGRVALGIAAALIAGSASPVLAAGGGSAKVPKDFTCADRESAARGEAWACVLLLDADGHPPHRGSHRQGAAHGRQGQADAGLVPVPGVARWLPPGTPSRRRLSRAGVTTRGVVR